MSVAVGAVGLERRPDAAVAPAAAHGSGERCDVAPAGPAVHAVVAVVAVDDVFVAGATADGVDTEAAADFVAVAWPAKHLVVAKVAEDPVGAGTTVDPVVAPATVNDIISGAAADDVVAKIAVDRVVAGATPDHLAVRGAVQTVIAGRTDDGRPVTVTHRRFFDAGCCCGTTESEKPHECRRGHHGFQTHLRIVGSLERFAGEHRLRPTHQGLLDPASSAITVP